MQEFRRFFGINGACGICGIIWFGITLALSGGCALTVKAPERSPDYLHMQWSFNLDPDYETGNLPISLVTPSINNGVLYAGGPFGEIAAHHLENGRKLWSEKHQGELSGSIGHYDNYVIYSTDEGRIYSRDGLTGKLNYMVDVGEASENRPAVANGRVIFHLRNHKIVCLDAQTGKILWSHKRSIPLGQTLQGTSSPYIQDQTLYIGFADGVLAAFRLEDGELQWERSLTQRSKFIDVDMTPILFQEHLWAAAFDGPLSSVDPQKGTLEKTNEEINITATPLVVNGANSHERNLILGTQGGELIRINDKNFPVIRKKVSDGGISSIVQWKNQLAVGTLSGWLLVVDVQTFETLARLHLGHHTSAIYSELVVGDNTLAVQSSRNRLYVFR